MAVTIPQQEYTPLHKSQNPQSQTRTKNRTHETSIKKPPATVTTPLKDKGAGFYTKSKFKKTPVKVSTTKIGIPKTFFEGENS